MCPFFITLFYSSYEMEANMKGIKDGMILQRNDNNVCEVVIVNENPLHCVRYVGVASGEADFSPCGKNRYLLTGIPVGGPYMIEVDGSRYYNIWVGDVWILAGQSNMEGVGWLTPEDMAFKGEEDVRALYMTNEWGVAKHPLHDLGHAYYKIHALLGGTPRPMFNSVGPGLSFGQHMKKLTGVPQGLLCCAHGATSLSHWSPLLSEQGPDASLYAAMIQRVLENGGRVRGMFWYQGCSDAELALYKYYTLNMASFVKALRRDLGVALPIVQVQIGRTVSRRTADQLLWWDSIKEQQRVMHEHISCLYTIAAIGKELDDPIHIDSKSQKELGREAAEVMYHLLYGYDKKGCLPPPILNEITVGDDGMTGLALLRLRYDNLHGGLISHDRPMGFEVLMNQESILLQQVFKTTLDGDCVVLHLVITPEELTGCQLYYGRGQDPACNVTDAAGRSIPAMGPIIL
jgi:sialate O-acetylesterase